MNQTTIKLEKHSWKMNLRDEADESVVNEIFKFREYKAVEEVLRTATSILDVGAHRGFFTLYARALNSRAQIVALEPEPKNIEAFQEHMQMNEVQGAALLPAALYTKSGTSALTVTADSHNHVLAQVDTAVGELVKVKTVTLADVLMSNNLTKIDVLKMDIEGAEYDILRSFGPSDWAAVQYIILEYHTLPTHKPPELEALLREHGFGVQKFPSSFDKTMGFFFARNKRT